MPKRKRKDYWDKRIRIPLGDGMRLWHCIKKVHGRAVDFAIVFRVTIDGKWHTVKRCDATPKHNCVPHCHLPKMNGEEHREQVGDPGANLGIIAHAIIRDIQENYTTIIDNYRHSH